MESPALAIRGGGLFDAGSCVLLAGDMQQRTRAAIFAARVQNCYPTNAV